MDVACRCCQLPLKRRKKEDKAESHQAYQWRSPRAQSRRHPDPSALQRDCEAERWVLELLAVFDCKPFDCEFFTSEDISQTASLYTTRGHASCDSELVGRKLCAQQVGSVYLWDGVRLRWSGPSSAVWPDTRCSASNGVVWTSVKSACSWRAWGVG